MHTKKDRSDAWKSLLRIIFMSIFLVCICILPVPVKSLAQETTDDATYAGSTSVKAYVIGNSENEQENNSKDEESSQDSSTSNVKTGDKNEVRFLIIIVLFSIIIFICGLKYKNRQESKNL